MTDVIDELGWAGRVINVELPGHSSAPTLPDYTVIALIREVAGF